MRSCNTRAIYMERPGGGQGRVRRFKFPEITLKARWNPIPFHGRNITILVLNNRVKQKQLLAQILRYWFGSILIRLHQYTHTHPYRQAANSLYMCCWRFYMNRNANKNNSLVFMLMCAVKQNSSFLPEHCFWQHFLVNDNHIGHPDQ